MVNVAVLGYGIVGSGVTEVINKNCSSIKVKAGKEIKVKKILDIRDFPNSPDRELLTKNSEDIFEDKSIHVVVETIGGAGVAYEFTKRALMSGKHVVTSNKELVAKHGPELLKIAGEKGVRYLFEASVGGGIPIIRPLEQCLAANDIDEVLGILNGTTNYILTQMRVKGKEFETALKEAQENGYAEADPTADIEGHDTCRKIAILSSIAYNEYVDYQNIATEGITKITQEDMEYAETLGAVIKLVAMSRKGKKGIYAAVGPMLVNKTHPLANVDDVFNAIMVKGNAVGETMFYGRGAGKLPTASAVVADIIDVVKHFDCGTRVREWQVNAENNMADSDEVGERYFIRIRVQEAGEARIMVREFFDQVEWIETIPRADELAFTTVRYSEKVLKDKLAQLAQSPKVENTINVLRILE